MIRPCALGIAGALTLMASIAPLSGQQSAHYRDFQFGSTLASVGSQTGVPAAEAKTIHTRPAILQDLELRRPYTAATTAPDPVQRIAFSFYNDQLFRLVIDYDRERTEGMTDTDMVEAISEMYGSVVKPTPKSIAAASRIDAESGTRIAGWGNTEYGAVLYRSSFASGFRMIVTSVRLNALARNAEAQAFRLDEQDAPQRERAREKKEADDARAQQQKARAANKASFVP
jgi:hypothetical protein